MYIRKSYSKFSRFYYKIYFDVYFNQLEIIISSWTKYWIDLLFYLNYICSKFWFRVWIMNANSVTNSVNITSVIFVTCCNFISINNVWNNSFKFDELCLFQRALTSPHYVTRLILPFSREQILPPEVIVRALVR